MDRTTRRLLGLAALLAAGAAAVPAVASASVQPVVTATCVGPRTVTIEDHRGLEGTRSDGPGTRFTFTLTSTGCAKPGAVFLVALPGSAEWGSDFAATSGTVEFDAGDLSDKSFTVVVKPDARPEQNEDFGVRMCPRTGQLDLARPSARAVIINDDGPPPGWTPPPPETDFHCSE